MKVGNVNIDNKQVVSITSSSTPTPVGDTTDLYVITALAANATFGAPTGTPKQGQSLLFRIKDDGTARTLAWNSIYRSTSNLVLPSITTVGETLYVEFVYNDTDSKWDLVWLSKVAASGIGRRLYNYYATNSQGNNTNTDIYTLPGRTLKSAGDTLELYKTGSGIVSSGNVPWKVFIGGTEIFSTTSTTADAWELRIKIAYVTGIVTSATMKYSTIYTVSGTNPVETIGTFTSFDTTGNVDIKVVTGTFDATSSRWVGEMSTIDYFPSA